LPRFLEEEMTTWEYKTVPVERTGTKEDFGFTWVYGPWEMRTDSAGKQALDAGLRELGGAGWELAGVMPTDLWAEGGRSAGASSGVRAIAAVLLFKRPLG
jgi:hypothetical protein